MDGWKWLGFMWDTLIYFKLLLGLWFASIFPFCWFLFSDASFHEKFTFIRQFVCCCCFSFAVCAFVFRKHLSNPTHWRFPPVFSYKSCMVSAFVFGSLTHFNPIFMSDVKCPSCLLWMWISNFFSYVLSWKELSFPSPPVEWSWHPWSK